MQLSDVFEDTDPLDEAVEEMEFQDYLKLLSELPKSKRKQLLKNGYRTFEEGGYFLFTDEI